MLKVESLDHEGRGVARRDGKVVFIEGALPGETVACTVRRKKPAFEVATVDAVLRESPYRVAPRCAHFGTCGGCSLQHLDTSSPSSKLLRIKAPPGFRRPARPRASRAPCYGKLFITG